MKKPECQQDSYEESLKQQVLRALTTTTFFLFISGVLLLTIFIVAYQPTDDDPWLSANPASISSQLSELFNNKVLGSSTFHPSGSLLLTGEDLINSTSGSNAQTTPPPNVSNDPVPRAQDHLRVCDHEGGIINCSDPGVLEAIRRINAEKFPEMEALQYETPVQAGESCDVAWSYSPRKEMSRRIYLDFRRYSLVLREPGCEVQVSEIGDWHSGKNARKSLRKANAGNLSNETGDGHVDDPAGKTFGSQRYLYYTRGGDYCKSMGQFMWSFLCALGESQYLNRTLVVDTENFCLSGRDNSPGSPDQPGKSLKMYIDYNHLGDSTPVIEKQEFISRWSQWNRDHKHSKIRARVIEDNLKTTPMDLQSDRASTVIKRSFTHSREPDNFWYRVCEGEAEKVIQRPWGFIWKPRAIMSIVNSICSKLEWDFDSIRVVRGEKAENRELWPNLERDTRPESILGKVAGRLNSTRYIYISSNERGPGFFNRIKEVYPGVSVLEDYKHLWEPGSEWYNETKALMKAKVVAPEFDGYMRDAVDSELFLRARTKIETFGDLTSDCKDGINTC